MSAEFKLNPGDVERLRRIAERQGEGFPATMKAEYRVKLPSGWGEWIRCYNIHFAVRNFQIDGNRRPGAG